MPEMLGSNRPSLEPIDIDTETLNRVFAETENPPEPEPQPQPRAEAEGEPSPSEDVREGPSEAVAPDTQAILAALDDLSARLDRREQKVESEQPTAPVAAQVPEALQALLLHEDETVREGARLMLERIEQQDQRLNAQDQRINALIDFAEAQSDQQAASAIEPQIAEAVEKYGLTDKEEDRVTAYFEEDESRMRVLGEGGRNFYEEGIRRLFPSKQPKGESKGAKPPGSNGAPARPTPGTVIAAGGGSAPAPRAEVKPGTSIDDFIENHPAFREIAARY